MTESTGVHELNAKRDAANNILVFLISFITLHFRFYWQI